MAAPEPAGEPVYQGKPLTFWCAQYAANYAQDANMELRVQAETAIRTLGTNGIPTLLHMLRAKDSKFKLKLIQLAQKQHLVNGNWTPAKLKHGQAILGFYALGSQGQSAVPALIKIYNECRSDPNLDPFEGDLRGIIHILAFMGPAAADAVPRLVQDTTDTNSDVRFAALWALGNIHAKLDLAVPALIRSLRDPVGGNRARAAIDLGAFGSDAQSAVPELINLLADPSVDIKNDAATALKRIDPEAAAKAGVK